MQGWVVGSSVNVGWIKRLAFLAEYCDATDPPVRYKRSRRESRICLICGSWIWPGVKGCRPRTWEFGRSGRGDFNIFKMKIEAFRCMQFFGRFGHG